MKELYYAKNSISRAGDEFILTIAENYNEDWQKISHKQYLNLVKDRVLKQLKQLEQEWSEEK